MQVDTARTPTDTLPAAPTVGNLPMVVTSSVRQVGDLIDATVFTPEQLGKRDSLAATVDFSVTNTILTFGVVPQRKMSAFLDTLLADIKVGDAGVAGTITLELSEGYNLMKIEQLKDRLRGIEPGFLGKLFGGAMTLAALVKNLADQTMPLLSRLDKVERIANERKRLLMTYNTKLDALQVESEGYILEMGVYIAAGEVALLRGLAEYESRKANLEAGHADANEPARLHDFARRIASFEQRLLKMKIAFVQAIAVNTPRIQAIRQAGEIQIQTILDALLFDVPNLKSLALQVAAMTNIMEADKEERRRDEITKKIAGAASDMFHETYITSVQSQGRGLEVVQQLADISDKLTATLREAAEIERQNHILREQASAELVKVKGTVMAALSELQPSCNKK